jgi:DNA (cytosine-5)-methyltransferase 1
VIDIRDLADADLPPADLVVATPPCQPYSMQGRREGFADPRAQVWWAVLRVLRASRAAVYVMENVPGLIHHDRGLTLGSMIEYLRLAGYRSRWEIIEATRVGAAQLRPRLYLVATKFDVPAFDFGRLPRLPPRPVADLLTPGPHVWLAPDEYTLVDPPARQPSGLIFAGYLNKPLRKPGRDPRLSSAHRTWARAHDSAGVYPTLVAGVRSGRYLLIRVGDRVRQLVPLECQRLQGFPDSFRFPFPAAQDHQIGNSVYVPLVRVLLREVRTQLFS